MGSVFLSFALECSHLPKNSILSAKRQFSARFSNCSNSLNFEAKINCNTTKQNDLKWRKTCTGSKLDLVHFNGPQTKFIVDSLYKHPVVASWPFTLKMWTLLSWSDEDETRGQDDVVGTGTQISARLCVCGLMWTWWWGSFTTNFNCWLQSIYWNVAGSVTVN